MKLEQSVNALQMRLRAFAFGEELDQLAEQLMSNLASYRRSRVDINNRVQLKALALMAEYLDAHGRSKEAASFLKLTAEELIDSHLGDGEDLKLMRQRVWCCLAYALTHLRANQTREAGRVIAVVRRFVEESLVRAEFPCHGTVALLKYYEGLWRRNVGSLDEAARCFDSALDQTRLRYEEKRDKYEAIDNDRLRRELVYSRVMMARILGFGHGGIALARGRYIEARGWMIGASQILSQLGQEHWRKGLEVYARSCAVLISELSPASIDRLKQEAVRLQGLKDWFESKNRRNEFVAGSFAILAELRVRQIEAGVVQTVNLDGMRKRIDALLKKAYSDAGPLSGSAALGLIECLLRGGDYEHCVRELEKFRRAFQGQDEIADEHQLLEAELWLQTDRLEPARGVLEALVASRVANRAYRARAWALLALCEKRSGRNAWAERALQAARDSVGAVQDAFTPALVEEISLQVETRTFVPISMPYQGSGEDSLWCDVDHNLEMARLNVVASVRARHPDYGVEKLAAVIGRGSSWLYALLGRHRGIDWVDGLLKRANQSA